MISPKKELLQCLNFYNMKKKIIKLLWIDDMESWAISAQTNLGIISNKYNVDLYVVNLTNGEDVIQQLNIDFDGVIMDYNMEPCNGDKYIQDIRFEEHLDGIPVVFYSQDNNTDLEGLVSDLRNVKTVYRPNLEDLIKEMFFF